MRAQVALRMRALAPLAALLGAALGGAAPAAAQLVSDGAQLWSRGAGGAGGVLAPDDRFGSAVATGDFDADGHLDLAIGMPFARVGTTDAAGAVVVLHGASAGLGAGRAPQTWDASVFGAAEVSARSLFGRSVAAGDFDCDGADDLAIGVPEQNADEFENVGTVNVLYGSAGVGLVTAGRQIWRRTTSGVPGAGGRQRFGAALVAADLDADGCADLGIGAVDELGFAGSQAIVLFGAAPAGLAATRSRAFASVAGAQSDDRFGSALAALDADGDGDLEFVVGVPDASVSGQGRAGRVDVFDGTPQGPDPDEGRAWSQASSGVPGAPGFDDRFGAALASGDFDGDGYADLAVGAPQEDVGGAASAGVVVVLRGSDDGLTGSAAQAWDGGDLPTSSAETDDRFGSALAAGDFDGDGFVDLAVGIPDEDLGAASSAGAVGVFLGGAAGLGATRAQVWSQATDGVPDATESGDRFGVALAAGDFDGDGAADLAIGVPEENLGTAPDAGAVQVLYGRVPPPTVVTEPATSRTRTSAKLEGTVRPNGTATEAAFEHGPTTEYGTTTDAVSLGSGTSEVAIDRTIAGLRCGTRYHFRAVATNAGGAAFGDDEDFRTSSCTAPTVSTSTATSVGATTATLRGTAVPNGADTTASFQYGPTTSYGSTVVFGAIGFGGEAVPFASAVADLACGRLHHYRAVATNASGTGRGADATFTTGACPAPTVTTSPPSAVTTSGATLHGIVTPNGAATEAAFEHGPTTSYGTTVVVGDVGAGLVPVGVSAAITGLACGQTVHYRTVAASVSGTARGDDVAFATAPCPLPSVTTQAPVGIGLDGATLRASVEPRGSRTAVRFEHGLTPSYGSVVEAGAVASGVAVATVTAPVAGLACGTEYHVRAVGTNAGGTAEGADRSFRTVACDDGIFSDGFEDGDLGDWSSSVGAPPPR